ncbi:hypothetical protein ACMFMG_010330 [Clarireedia jacksonii]
MLVISPRVRAGSRLSLGALVSPDPSTLGATSTLLYTLGHNKARTIFSRISPLYNQCSDGKSHGTLYSDGSDYQVCLVDRGNNYLQNWSVCKNKRTSGTVTMANYYNYYQSQGMTDNPLSAAAYQIVSMEYCGSSGSVSITVSSDAPVGSSNSSTPSMPSTSASSIPSSIPISGNCAQLYGQWGGIG